jgi:YidC/Oxa1 family membrane protein insertase
MAVIIVGGLILLHYITGPKPEPQTDTPSSQPAETQSTSTSEHQADTADATREDPSAGASKPWTKWWFGRGKEPGCTLGSLTRSRKEEGKETPKDYLLQVKLRGEGAAIESVQLTDYFQTVADKRLFDKLDKDEARYAAEAAGNPEKYKGHYAVLSPVDFKNEQYYSLATRGMEFAVGPRPDTLPKWTNIRTQRWELKPVLETDDSQSAVFEWNIYSEKNPESLAVTIRKTYTVTRGSYSIGVTLECINHTDQPVHLQFDQTGPIGVTQEDPRADQRTAVAARLTEGNEIQRQDFSNAELGKKAYGEAIPLGRSDAKTDPVVWMAYVNKFFGSILYLEPKNKDNLNAAATNAQFFLRPVQQNEKERMWETGVWLQDIDLAKVGKQQATRTLRFNLFTGPKIRQLFKDNPLYARLHYNETFSKGSCCSWNIFDPITDILMWLLGFFSTFLFENYGLAIILLVIIVRVLLHPLTKYSQVSMARMQKSMAALKPQIEKIREKYANDRATQQREMLKLQKEAGVGPGQMLGCLPMFLQMPIWIALYTGLNTEVALRHEAFLPVWITDLAAPDHLFRFGTDLPLVGEYFNLLPILLTVAMFLSMKLNPAAATQASSPEQKQQQMMMKLMMPVMMLFFFYNAPSGLTLYIMASTFAGVAESYYIRRHIKEKEELEAATETVVKVSGKGPRGSRPKKPKGPFWTKRG